jgi:hypothetical protein
MGVGLLLCILDQIHHTYTTLLSCTKLCSPSDRPPPTPQNTPLKHTNRSIEVESGPDADTPRPVGVGLLLCMLERGGDQVAQALLELTGQLQVSRVRHSF